MNNTSDVIRQMEWHRYPEEIPPVGERVIAAHSAEFSGEAYVASDGAWYRLYGAKWNAVFGTDRPVTHWSYMPRPSLEEGHTDGI